jgi:uncharacterized protein
MINQRLLRSLCSLAISEYMSHYEELKTYLKKFNKVIVAFSGGIDSYFVLKTAVDSLGNEHVLAVTGDSPSLKESEREQTALLAKNIGVRHKVIFTEEMSNPNYYNNPQNRCFFCKDELYKRLDELKKETGFDIILDGTNFDDMSDYRPGYQASKNHGIISPLVELKFTKVEIRNTARSIGLEIWDKPSSPCLSSRIPYGQKVTLEKLSLIEKAEEVLKQLGFRDYRVRHFEIPQNGNETKLKLAKIDIANGEIVEMFDSSLLKQVNEKLKSIGYDFVTLDIGGLKSGSMNMKVKK